MTQMAQRRVPHNDKLGSSGGSFAQYDGITPDDSLIEETIWWVWWEIPYLLRPESTGWDIWTLRASYPGAGHTC